MAVSGENQQARDVLAKRCEEYSEEPYNLADRLIMDLFSSGYEVVGTIDVMGRPTLTITLDENEVDMLWHALGVYRRRVLISPEMKALMERLETWLIEHPAPEDTDDFGSQGGSDV